MTTQTQAAPPADPLATLRDELADFSAHQTAEARHHFLGGIAALMHAHNATWIAAVRMDALPEGDPLNGWRPRLVERLNADNDTRAFLKAKAKQVHDGKPDPVTIRRVTGAGTFRVHRLCDIAPEGWQQSDYYQTNYLDRGHCDSIWGAIPISHDLEIYVGAFRALDQPFFSAAEAATFATALKGMKWFHLQQVLGEGIRAASAPLSPGERRVLHALLQGLSEQEIAFELSKSPHTIHDQVKSVFRKYGVRSRPALMALWLGKALSSPKLEDS